MKYKLKEIGKIVTGCTPKTKDKKYYASKEYLFIGPTDLKDCKYVRKSEKHISDIAYNDYSSRFINSNSIMVDCIGSDMGNVALSTNKVLTNQQINSITEIDKNIFNVDYIYYVLSTMKNYFHQIGTNGSTMPIINKSMFEEIEIDIPQKYIQDKVVGILCTIDKKIELNNQIDNNLYEIGNEIYNKFFIQDKDNLWDKDRLGNYLSLDRGISYKGKFLSNDGTPMINLGNIMPNGIFRLEKIKFYSGNFKEKVIANIGDIVIANTDMTQNREILGAPVIIPPIFAKKVIFSHHIYCLRNLKLPKMFVYYLLLTDEWNAKVGNSATGTTVLALPKEVIENYNITIPDKDKLNKFENIAEMIQSKKNQILLENIKLKQLKDTLLPKLLNGEINLENVEI